MALTCLKYNHLSRRILICIYAIAALEQSHIESYTFHTNNNFSRPCLDDQNGLIFSKRNLFREKKLGT